MRKKKSKVTEDKNDNNVSEVADNTTKNKDMQEKDDKPLDEKEQYQKQVEELNDKYLRLYAEFDNYRKRTIRERAEIIQTASGDVILALLPVIDDFDRAVKIFDEAKEKDVESLFEGVKLIQSKIKTILGQKGLQEMETHECDFNTDIHEAVAEVPAAAENMKGKVVDVVEKGYNLNGKVLRFAKVVVGN